MSGRHQRIKQTYHKQVAGSKSDPCVYCGDYANTIDHIIPQSKGGTDDVQNLTPMCDSCNRDKADISVLMALLLTRMRRRINVNISTEKNKQKRKRF